MGELYGRLKTNLINLIFFRNIEKGNETLQNTSRDHAKEPRNCQHCSLPQIKPFYESFFSFVRLQHQEFEGLSGCLPLLERGCTGGGQWWPVREKLF